MKRSTGYSQANDKVTEMNTLTACLAKAVQDGYTEDFQVKNGKLYSMREPELRYAPEDVRIPNFYRFEGDSDPGDMTVLYVLETTDGRKGTLIDAYGTYADGSINKFITQVTDFHKKVIRSMHGPGEIPDAPADV